MYDHQPKCEFCGKFIATEENTLGKTWDVKLVWQGGAVPEPSHDVFWHIECKEDHGVEDYGKGNNY